MPPITTSDVAPGAAPFAQLATLCHVPEAPEAKTAPAPFFVNNVWPLPPVAK